MGCLSVSRRAARSKSIDRLRDEIVEQFGESFAVEVDTQVNSCVIDGGGKALAVYYWRGNSDCFDSVVRQYGRLIIEMSFENGEE